MASTFLLTGPIQEEITTNDFFAASLCEASTILPIESFSVRQRSEELTKEVMLADNMRLKVDRPSSNLGGNDQVEADGWCDGEPQED